MLPSHYLPIQVYLMFDSVINQAVLHQVVNIIIIRDGRSRHIDYLMYYRHAIDQLIHHFIWIASTHRVFLRYNPSSIGSLFAL